MTASTLTPGRTPHSLRRPRWWSELALIAIFYVVYSAARNLFGSAAVSATTALRNAERLMDVERAFGIFNESVIQGWFLDADWFLRVWNIYYGTLHFVVPIAALLFLYGRFPHLYRLWRNTLAATTGLALVGFSLFPMMPPRLLGQCGTYGGCINAPFVDTLAQAGGLWSFDSDAVQSVSNQFAAMPSLHFAWSAWCFLVFFPRLRNPVGRVLIALYPVATLFAIIVTGNHYWADALGGAATLAAGYGVARLIQRWTTARDAKRNETARRPQLIASDR